jgi:DNA polymerase-3 subunit delta'
MLFNQIIGQREIIERLIQTVRENRVAHAQLFFGGEGYGKFSLAIAYAQFINCRDQNKTKTGDSCGKCPSCIKYNKLIHPDLHFIFPVATNKDVKEKPISRLFMASWREFVIENNYFISLNDWYDKIEIEKKQAGISVNDCNEIIKTLSYTSYESEYKVMIIWMVEKLNYQAAPKLLKILEEPPDKTLFLLVSEQPDQIISTILSRLLLVKIPKIEDRILVEVCQKNLQMGHEEVVSVVHIANGSYKEAIRLAGQAETRKKNYDKFVAWMRNCWAPKVPEIVAFTEAMARESRESNKSFLQFGLSMLRNCFVLNYSDRQFVRTRKEEEKFSSDFSGYVHKGNIVQFSDEFNKAIMHIERNVHVGMVFMDLSLTVFHLLKIPKQTP